MWLLNLCCIACLAGEATTTSAAGRFGRQGKAIIIHCYPLDAAPEALATARDRVSGTIKVVLEP